MYKAFEFRIITHQSVWYYTKACRTNKVYFLAGNEFMSLPLFLIIDMFEIKESFIHLKQSLYPEHQKHTHTHIHTQVKFRASNAPIGMLTGGE